MNCGSNSNDFGLTAKEISTCFLAYGGLAASGSVEDTVFQCACKAEYNNANSTGLKCYGK